MNALTRLSLNRWLVVGSRCCAASLAAGIPSLTELWRDRGLSRGDFYLLEILFAVALLSLEVVTGRVADRIGKVFTMRCGFAALAAGSLIYWLSSSFGGFLFGEVVLALGIALISGTEEAMMFQSCKVIGPKESFQRLWTFSIGASFVCAAVAALLGARLSTVSLSAPYLMCMGSQVLGLLLCFVMVEPPKLPPKEGEGGSRDGTLQEAVSAVLLKSSHIRWMAIAPGFVVAINQTFLWMYPEYLAECGIGRGDSGFVFALFNIIAGALAVTMRDVKDPKKATRIMFALIPLLVLSTLGLITTAGGLAWLLILPQQVVRSVSGALFGQTINDAIPDAVRATALSVRNATHSVLYVAAMVPWWLGVDVVGRNGMFGFNLTILIVGGVVLWVSSPRALRQ